MNNFSKNRFITLFGQGGFHLILIPKDPFTLDGVSIINDSIPDKLDLFKELNLNL